MFDICQFYNVMIRPDIIDFYLLKATNPRDFLPMEKKSLPASFFLSFDIIKIEMSGLFFLFYRPTLEKVPREDPRC